MHYTQAYDITDESAADVINAITEACAVAIGIVSFAIDDTTLWLRVDGNNSVFKDCKYIVAAYFNPISGD